MSIFGKQWNPKKKNPFSIYQERHKKKRKKKNERKFKSGTD